MDKIYYIYQNKNQVGPYNLDELKSMNLSGDDYIWYEGRADWAQIKNIPEISNYIISSQNSFQPEISETDSCTEKERDSPEDKPKFSIDNQYYIPSGKFDSKGIAIASIVGFISVLIFGAIYGFAVQYNPIIYVNFLLTIGLGYALGYSIFIGGKIGKIRSPKVSAVIGLVIGLFGVYIGWVFYLFALTIRSDQAILILNPLKIFEILGKLSETGLWSFSFKGRSGEWTPTGIFLYLFWIGEFAIIVITTLIVSSSKVKDTPFCEECNNWTAQIFKKIRFGPVYNKERMKIVKNMLETNNISLLAELGTSDPKWYTEMTIKACPICKELGYISLIAVEYGKDKKGKEKKKATELFNNYIIYLKTIPENWLQN